MKTTTTTIACAEWLHCSAAALLHSRSRRSSRARRVRALVLTVLALTALCLLEPDEHGQRAHGVHAQLGVPSGNLCSALNNCNGHGRCVTSSKTCICFEGFGADTDIANYKSPDCSLRTTDLRIPTQQHLGLTASSRHSWNCHGYDLLTATPLHCGSSHRRVSIGSVVVGYPKRSGHCTSARRVLRRRLLRPQQRAVPMLCRLRRHCLSAMYVACLFVIVRGSLGF